MANENESLSRLSAQRKGPLYQRLAEVLVRKIEAGDYKKGDLFPGDKQLSAQYGVSLITVRTAMRLLIERGLVARYVGKGSFVLSQKQIRAQWGLGSFDDLVETGSQARMIMLRKELIVPPKWVAQKYLISPRTKVYWFRAVRTKVGDRFLLNDVYHTESIGSKINKLNFDSEIISNKLMIALVEEYCGVILNNMNQTMSAESASADVAKQLGIKAGRPILVMDRDYFSTEGDLVQVTRSRYRLDHYRYTINVARLANSPTERRDLVGYFGANARGRAERL